MKRAEEKSKIERNTKKLKIYLKSNEIERRCRVILRERTET